MGWESLPNDLLVRIYSRLGIEELLVGSPLACRNWYSASLDPGLYKVIDLQDWVRIYRRLTGGDRTKGPLELWDLIQTVVPRGGEAIECLKFPDLVVTESDFVFVADRCPNLKCFSLRRPKMISKRAFCYAIRKWKDLEGMDVDEYALKQYILEEINSSCKRFVSLRVARKLSIYDAPNIVRHLPKLKSVDLSNTDFRYDTLLIILKGCKELESLDITGCGDVGIDPEVQTFAAGLKKFQFDKGPFAEKVACFCPDCADEDYYKYGTSGKCSCSHDDYYRSKSLSV